MQQSKKQERKWEITHVVCSDEAKTHVTKNVVERESCLKEKRKPGGSDTGNNYKSLKSKTCMFACTTTTFLFQKLSPIFYKGKACMIKNIMLLLSC